MVEGIPAFFAASRYGVATIVVMAVLFAASTMATYLVRSVAAASGLQRLKLGAFEQYGEIISGLFVALVGLAFGSMSIRMAPLAPRDRLRAVILRFKILVGTSISQIGAFWRTSVRENLSIVPTGYWTDFEQKRTMI